MATFRMLNPGLAEVDHGMGAPPIAVPMSEQDALANGLQPAQPAAPGGIPLPGPNPYAGLPPEAVAGPGGGPIDPGQGAGVFGGPPPAQSGDPNVFRQAYDDAVTRGGAHAPQPDRFATHPIAEAPAGPAAESGEGLVPIQPKAQQSRPTGQRNDGPIDPLVLEAMQQRGGGGGPARLRVASETRKYHQSGPVDPALARDIGARQDELDQGESNSLEDAALHKGDYLEQQAALQQQQAQMVQQQIERRQAVDNELASYKATSDQKQAELMNAHPRTVDDFWKDQGVALGLATAVSVALGAWGTTLRGGGENPGMALLNSRIDHWVNDQRQQYEVAKDKATVSKNAYKDALDTFGSPAVAQANLQLQALAAKDALIKNTAEQIGTQDALGQAQLEMQKNQLQRKQLQAQAQMAAGADVEAKFTMQGGGGAGGAGGVLGALKRGSEAAGYLKNIKGGTTEDKAEAKDARSRQVRLPDGSYGFTPDGVSREKIQHTIDGRADLKSKLEQLAHMQESENMLDPTVRAKYNALASFSRTQANVLMEQGAMSEGDKANVTMGIPDPSVVMGRTAAAALRQTIAAHDSSLQAAIRNSVYKDPSLSESYAAPAAQTFQPGLP